MNAGITGLQPWLQPYARALLYYFPDLTVTSTFRSISDQIALYRNRARNPYPVAPPGRSYHNYGRAFDLTGRPDRLAYAGAVWRSWGGTYDASDPIHFQV